MSNYQELCYTNVTKMESGQIKTGWDALLIEGADASTIYEEAKSMMAVHSRMSGGMVDDDGKPLHLLEIESRSERFYITSYQYGSKDYHGRENMFAHTYSWGWNDVDMLDATNIISSIAKESFYRAEEELSTHKRPVFYQGITLESSISTLGMSREQVETFLYSVYLRLSSRRYNEPLYIQYEQKEEIPFIQYLIYSLLPFSLRKQISIAQTPSCNTTNKKFVFTRQVHDKKHYLNPKTGETNFVTEHQKNFYRRLTWISYVLENYNSQGLMDYFRELNRMMASTYSEDCEIESQLEVAHQFLIKKNLGDYTNEQLSAYLYHVLNFTNQARVLQEHLQQPFDEFLRRGMTIGKSSEKRLFWLERVTDGTVATSIRTYLLQVLSNLPEDEAISYLIDMDEEQRERFIVHLSRDATKASLLDAYLCQLFIHINAENPQEIIAFLEVNKQYLLSSPKLRKMIKDAAWRNYLNNISRLETTIRSYKIYVKTIECVKSGNPNEFAACQEMAKEEFWHRLDVNSFNDSQILREIARELEVKSPKWEFYRSRFQLIDHVNTRSTFKEVVEELVHFLSNHHILREIELNQKDALHIALNDLQTTSIEDKEWIRLVFSATDIELMDILLKIRDRLYAKEFDELIDEGLLLDEKFAYSSEYRELKVDLANTIVRKLNDFSNRIQIPFDVWLFVAAYLQDDPLFLDALGAETLSQNLEEDFAISRLRDEKVVRRFVEKYIDSKGNYKKYFKAVLKDKKKPKDLSDSPKKEGKGLLDRIFGRGKK
ncbi:TPA: hypothetical protein ACGO2A_000901 [Streptococcus suis]|uniref:hypothetical protein n=2 Tax=Streptococcus suis TaxID=1307 RepID=UPI000CF5BD64|nr:hypothetical protein [Streptococcus suis]MBY4955550.1 hypothetical protein [Streptococcus suis]MBY4970280.1 hypothetical protein [Streptococcus suis]MBY5016757.1 hypothetical protein [Streptococcus suis]NQJ69942.1 hypothetical protein [Streptococcus suis]NQJ73307.1 hypothetical protein [Streptococcus suis]